MQDLEKEKIYTEEDLQENIKKELFNPEIQMYNKDMMNYFLRKINIQEHKLESDDFNLSNFAKEIMTYDLDRIKYYLKRYLRVRLRKIEKNLFYII